MNWNMKNEIVQINESEYKAMIQAVAVIKGTRNDIWGQLIH